MSLDARIARIEAQLAITQLVSRYAMAVDARDLESLADLFVDDVNCGRLGTGRAALISSFAGILGPYRSMHQVCGQKIDLVDEDHATGQVYCRAERDDGDHWVTMAISYLDTYERRAQGWRFVRRKLTQRYATDWQERPAAPS